jgi:transglutaminase-like putative cysteine protease
VGNGVAYRLRIEHRTRYRYANPVYSSFNEARITPMTTPNQVVLDSHVDVQPVAAGVQTYVDYWGSVVHAFDLHQPHEALTITGRSVVEAADWLPAAVTRTWPELHDDRVRDRWSELLSPTAQVPADDRLTELADQFHQQLTPQEAVAAAVSWVGDELSYVSGTTGVHTSAIEAWEGGQGVCQDFAHLTLALLRAMGVPSRYCSGYHHPSPDAPVGSTVDGESHAWVEAWTGDWLGIDPTAGEPTGERHVLVARGRDYSDVTPVKGIFQGGPTEELEASVRLTRLA